MSSIDILVMFCSAILILFDFWKGDLEVMKYADFFKTIGIICKDNDIELTVYERELNRLYMKLHKGDKFICIDICTFDINQQHDILIYIIQYFELEEYIRNKDYIDDICDGCYGRHHRTAILSILQYAYTYCMGKELDHEKTEKEIKDMSTVDGLKLGIVDREDLYKYRTGCADDAITTKELFDSKYLAQYGELMSKLNDNKAYSMTCIKDVIYNDPATIVFWADGTKTVVKAEGEAYDPEKGLAMAMAKKSFGNKGWYYEIFKKWLPKEYQDSKSTCSSADSVEKVADTVSYDPATYVHEPYVVWNQISVRQAKIKLACSDSKICRMIKSGQLKAKKDASGKWWINADYDRNPIIYQ